MKKNGSKRLSTSVISKRSFHVTNAGERGVLPLLSNTDSAFDEFGEKCS